MVKNLTAMWEIWFRSLGWEDSLKVGMATHCSILACRIPMDRGVWQAIVNWVAKSRTRLSDQAHTQHKGKLREEMNKLLYKLGLLGLLGVPGCDEMWLPSLTWGESCLMSGQTPCRMSSCFQAAAPLWLLK